MATFFLATVRKDESTAPVPTFFNDDGIQLLEKRGDKAYLHVRSTSEILECIEPFDIIKERMFGNRSKGFWDVLDDLLKRLLPQRRR